MAAHSASFPTWLLDCKEEVIESETWKSIKSELFEAVHQQLIEAGIPSFTDLSEAERTLFIDRAIRAIQQGRVYNRLGSDIANSLDQHLNNQVAGNLLKDNSPLSTKSEMVIDNIREGAVSILKRWPDLKSRLRVCFNRLLPDKLRQLIWKVFLQKSNAGEKYLDLVKKSPKQTMSVLDLDITKKCEHVLQSEPTLKPLANNINILTAMKLVVSYYHVTRRTKSPLVDSDFYLAVPFLVTALATSSPKQLVQAESVASVIEQYFTFMKDRPLYMKESWNSGFDESLGVFVSQVINIIKSRNGDLLDHFKKMFSPQDEESSDGGSSTDDFTSDKPLVEEFKSIIRPLVRRLFVGYLKLDTVMFIWDQHILGLDTPNYDIIPFVTAATLLLMKDKILKCEAISDLEEALQAYGVSLSEDMYMFQINHHFLEELQGKLNSADHQPIFDPTRIIPHWSHWFGEKLPQRLTAQDRHSARKERLEQRRKALEEQRRQQELEGRDRDEAGKGLELIALDEERSAARRMEDLLEEERKRHWENEQQSQEEIEALRKEIEQLRQRPVHAAFIPPPKRRSVSPSVISHVTGFHAPPPSAATIQKPRPSPQVPSPAPIIPSPSPSEATSPNRGGTQDQESAKQLFTDLVRRIMDSVRWLGHGEGDDTEALDNQTKASIATMDKSFKESELEVFGRKLRAQDWDALSVNSRADASDKVMTRVRKKYEDRYAAEVKKTSKK